MAASPEFSLSTKSKSHTQIASIENARPQNSFRGCSRISDYTVLRKLGEGTFGEVHSARSKKSGEVVALKKILMHNEKDGFPITALREIKILKLLSHTNVLKLEDMAIEHHQKSTDKRKRAIVYMVTPYMDHDLSGLLENPNVNFSEPQIKCYMLQLLQGTQYLHENHILHRDMKAANLLISNKGVLQIADFGLARHYDEPIPVAGYGGGEARRDYTTLVVTRWYRPPELLLHLKKYTTAIDLWGVGCVFGEMLIGKPILAGDSDTNQLRMIFDLVGSPTEENMPKWRSLPGAEGLNFPARPSTLSQRFREYGSGAISLLNELLKLDWRKRVNAIDALKHPYFRNVPLPAKPGELPAYEDSHELDRRKFRSQKAALPPAPKGGTVGTGAVNNWGGEQSTNGSRIPPQAGYWNGAPLEERKPAWRRDRDDRPDTRLPPRPPPVEHLGYDAVRTERTDGIRSRSRDVDREWPALRVRNNGSSMDTYIPTYGSENNRRDERPGRDDRRRREDRKERRPERLDYDDRTRAGLPASRSRSPVRSRDRDRFRERESLDRDWDGYRR